MALASYDSMLLVCTLAVYLINEPPLYKSLSYVWGPPIYDTLYEG